jgi:hypothetical protein
MSQLLCHIAELVEGKWMTFATDEAEDETFMVKKSQRKNLCIS